MNKADLIGVLVSLLGTGLVGAVLLALRRIIVWAHDMRTAIMGEPRKIIAGIEIDPVPSLGERFNELAARVCRIEHEYRQDNGTTMRDAIDDAVRASEASAVASRATGDQVHGLALALAQHLAAPLGQAHQPRDRTA